MKAYFRRLAEEEKRAARERRGVVADNAAAPPAPQAATSVAKAGDGFAAAKDESITNTQHAGVDEGGIVKVHGDHLVILRRGRLFTVRIGGNALEPASSVNAYPPNINPSNDWYDEMLVSKDTVVVIGYSYGLAGTEINLFNINDRGYLKYLSTYHLRSNYYYSSHNYATPLIRDKL